MPSAVRTRSQSSTTSATVRQLSAAKRVIELLVVFALARLAMTELLHAFTEPFFGLIERCF